MTRRRTAEEVASSLREAGRDLLNDSSFLTSAANRASPRRPIAARGRCVDRRFVPGGRLETDAACGQIVHTVDEVG